MESITGDRWKGPLYRALRIGSICAASPAAVETTQNKSDEFGRTPN